MNLIIDVGNTRTKVAVFERDNLVDLNIVVMSDLHKLIKNLFEKFDIQDSIVSKVTDLPKDIIEELSFHTNFLLVNSATKIPFINLYKTKSTLGLDRIALATAAVKNFYNKNVLVIDAGTCITYDFVNDKLEYKGGAISPGLSMRYKSLHTFTSKLPELAPKHPKTFIGNSTLESIHSGVVNGLIQEICGVIDQYKKVFFDLTVVLTGGDTKFLSEQLKSSIFANQNFLLEGLNEILIFNKTND